MDLFHRGDGVQNGLGLVMMSLDQADVVQSVAGLQGAAELDLMQPISTLSALSLSTVGTSRLFVSLPTDSRLVGTEFWLQGLVLPAGGLPGLTNAVREVVLP